MLYSVLKHRKTLISEDIDYTGHMLWPGSHALMLFILSNSRFFEGKRVLELGSGSGRKNILFTEYSRTYWTLDCKI